MGQQVGTAVGFVAGFFLPGGPQVWAGIGGIVGGAIKPEQIQGPRIGEIERQTAAEGGPRPIIFGRSQPIAGNIIADSEPRIVKRKESGKGGPEVNTESAYRTYAVGVCRGPITAFLQIWKNGTLVYDAEDPSMEADNEQFLKTARLYLGGYDQMPSPDLEAVHGVGNVHGYRGTAYMVLADEDVTEQRGMWSQWQFRVARFAQSNQGEWWAVRPTESDIATLRYLWRAPSPDAFTTGETRGPPSVGLNNSVWTTCIVKSNKGTVVLFGSEGTVEVYNSFGAPIGTPTIVEIFSVDENIRRIKNHVDLLVCETTIPGFYFTSADGGYTWIERSTPDGLYLRSICRLDSLRWVAFFQSGSDQRLMYSDQVVPTIWTEGYSASPAPTSISDMVADGNVAVVFASLGRVFRSVGGAVWTYSDIGIVSHSGSFAWSANDVIVFGDTNSINLEISRDKGQSWQAIDIGQTGKSVHYGGGKWVVSGRPTFRTIVVSSDDFETFNIVEMPGSDSTGQNYIVRHVSTANDYKEGFYSLPQLVTELSEYVSMDPSMIDVSLLDGYLVRGLTITNTYPAYEILKTLSQFFFFMPSNVSGQVKFVPFGGNTVATISDDDLVGEVDDEDSEMIRRSDALVVPPKLHLNYFDVNGGLNTDKQSSERPRNGRAYGEQSMQTPVTSDADEAATVVAKTHAMMVEQQRGEVKFSLPDKFLYLTESDPIFFQNEGRTDRLVITKVETQIGQQDYTAVRDRQSIHTLSVEGFPAAPVTRPPSNVIGQTLIEFIDSPILRSADDQLGYYIAVSGVFPAWRGCQIELSIDGGETWADSAVVGTGTVMGALLTEMPDHPQEYPDENSSIQVTISTADGALFDTTIAGMMNRLNLAMIGDEMVNFATVDEPSEGVWDVSYFLRGRKGTETSAHEVGERFVMLDNVFFVPADLTLLNRTLTFRATSLGTSVADATIISAAFTGRSQTERQPAYLQVYPSGTDIVISWQGVGRLGGGVNVAMGAYFAGYRVTLTDGSTTQTFDTAEQTLTTSLSAFSGPVTVSVQQRNQLTGLGPAAQVIYANP